MPGRGPGRPPKNAVGSPVKTGSSPVKRGRGRPRKNFDVSRFLSPQVINGIENKLNVYRLLSALASLLLLSL